MKEFLGLLDSPGGHILVCLALIVGGAVMATAQVDIKDQLLVVFALGVLGRSMLGRNGKTSE